MGVGLHELGMRYLIYVRALGSVGVFLVGLPCMAEQENRFAYEFEVELGVEVNVPHAGGTTDSEAFFSAEFGVEFQLTDKFLGFAELSLDGAVGKFDNKSEQSTDLELEQLGLTYDGGTHSASAGLIALRFGIAKDAAPGYFADDLVEEYDLSNAFGLTTAFEVGDGILSASFFAEEEWHLNASTNVDDFGNFALQYDLPRDNNTYHFGLRSLSRGLEGENIERGAVLGLTARLVDDLLLITEVASFQNWNGSPERAVFATVGAEYYWDHLAYSAAYSQKVVSEQATDQLLSLGVDWHISDETMLSVGYALGTEDRSKSSRFAVSFTRLLEK